MLFRLEGMLFDERVCCEKRADSFAKRAGSMAMNDPDAVSYTHLTLPTICSV